MNFYYEEVEFIKKFGRIEREYMRKILTLYINCTEVREVQSEKVKIVQIFFDGRAEGAWFNGEIEPGGVDTQTINLKDDSGTLSARYTILGTDNEGKNCRMYINNNAIFGEEYTMPSIVTDSEALKWLNDAKLKGKIVTENDQLRIEIYEENT